MNDCVTYSDKILYSSLAVLLFCLMNIYFSIVYFCNDNMQHNGRKIVVNV